MIKLLSLFVCSFVLAACAHTSSTKTSSPPNSPGFEAKQVILPESEAIYYNRKDRVFFTADFTPEDVSALQKWGIDYLIYIIDDIEPTPEMLERVEAAGITVIPLEFFWEGRQASAKLEAIEKVFMKHHRERREVVAVVSSDWDNVRAWLAYHLRKAHGMKTDEALSSSEALGEYSSDQARARARKLIQKI